jgi:hypothetical protein
VFFDERIFELEATSGNAFLKRFGSRAAFDAFDRSNAPEGAAGQHRSRLRGRRLVQSRLKP